MAALRGLADTLDILRQVPGPGNEPAWQQAILMLDKLVAAPPLDLEDLIYRIRSAARHAKAIEEALPADGSDPRAYWARQVAKQVEAWNAIIDKYLRPVEVLAASPPQLMSLGETAHEFRREALAATFSLRDLATTDIPRLSALLAFFGSGGRIPMSLSRCASGSTNWRRKWTAPGKTPRFNSLRLKILSAASNSWKAA